MLNSLLFFKIHIYRDNRLKMPLGPWSVTLQTPYYKGLTAIRPPFHRRNGPWSMNHVKPPQAAYLLALRHPYTTITPRYGKTPFLALFWRCCNLL